MGFTMIVLFVVILLAIAFQPEVRGMVNKVTGNGGSGQKNFLAIR